MSSDEQCFYCDSTDIAYIDVLDIRWCSAHYQDIFLGEPSDGLTE